MLDMDPGLRSLAAAALALYDLDGAACSLLQWEDNAVFEVRHDGRRLVLRLGNPAGAGHAEQLAELYWLSALCRDTELAVPRPCRTRDGGWVGRVAAPDEPRCCVLLEWVDGDPLPVGLDPGDAARAGELLAGLHAHADGLALPAGFVRPAIEAAALFGANGALRPDRVHPVLGEARARVVEGLARRLDTELAGRRREPGRWGLVHGDFHRDNILSDGRRIAAIDFDDCGWGERSYDVATALYSIEGRLVPDGADVAPYREAFLAGYERVRRLECDDAEIAAMTLLRRAVVLAFLVGTDNPNVLSWRDEAIDELICEVEAAL